MDPNVTLRPDQIEDLATLIVNRRHGLGHEPACGKTPTVCALQWYLANEKNEYSAWVMPKSLLQKNKRELLRFTHFTPADLCILESEDQIADQKVFLMTFERFRRSGKKLPDRVRNFAGDEFHMGYKGGTSKRSIEMLDWVRRRDAGFTPMTGTLIDGKIEAAYPAIHAIEPRYYGNYQAFMNYHVVQDILTGQRIGVRNEDKLRTILKTHFIWRTFEQTYGKEAKLVVTEEVDMNPRQRGIYDELEAEAIVELERFFIDGTLPGVALIRARQIMEHPNQFPNLAGSGFVDICPGERSAKEERCEIHLTDAYERGKPIVIFAALKPQQRELFALAQKVGLRTGLINSDTSGQERDRIDLAFQAGELQSIICSPACAGVGFNWQYWGDKEVDHIVMASLDFLDTSFIQAYRRFIRGKRATPLRITVLSYCKSLDQHLFNVLHTKSKEANRFDGVRQILNLNKSEVSTYVV
jgi:hypothetical protein